MGDKAVAALVVADTGPLLCVGGEAANASTGIRMLASRSAGRLWIPLKVHEELANQVKRGDTVGEAARQAILASEQLFQIHRESFRRKTRDAVFDMIIAAERQRRGRRAKEGDHWGETDAILLAQAKGAVLLTNDEAAIIVAQNLNVTVGTYAHVLRAEMEDQRLDAVDAFAACGRLGASGIDHGLRDMRALAINKLDVLPGL